MAHRNLLAIDLIGSRTCDRRRQVRDDLVTMKVEIDPFLRGPTFRAAKQVAVEAARFGEIAHGKGKMESRAVHNRLLQRGMTSVGSSPLDVLILIRANWLEHHF